MLPCHRGATAHPLNVSSAPCDNSRVRPDAWQFQTLKSTSGWCCKQAYLECPIPMHAPCAILYPTSWACKLSFGKRPVPRLDDAGTGTLAEDQCEQHVGTGQSMHCTPSLTPNPYAHRACVVALRVQGQDCRHYKVHHEAPWCRCAWCARPRAHRAQTTLSLTRHPRWDCHESGESATS